MQQMLCEKNKGNQEPREKLRRVGRPWLEANMGWNMDAGRAAQPWECICSVKHTKKGSFPVSGREGTPGRCWGWCGCSKRQGHAKEKRRCICGGNNQCQERGAGVDLGAVLKVSMFFTVTELHLDPGKASWAWKASPDADNDLCAGEMTFTWEAPGRRPVIWWSSGAIPREIKLRAGQGCSFPGQACSQEEAVVRDPPKPGRRSCAEKGTLDPLTH